MARLRHCLVLCLFASHRFPTSPFMKIAMFGESVLRDDGRRFARSAHTALRSVSQGIWRYFSFTNRAECGRERAAEASKATEPNLPGPDRGRDERHQNGASSRHFMDEAGAPRADALPRVEREQRARTRCFPRKVSGASEIRKIAQNTQIEDRQKNTGRS